MRREAGEEAAACGASTGRGHAGVGKSSWQAPEPEGAETGGATEEKTGVVTSTWQTLEPEEAETGEATE